MARKIVQGRTHTGKIPDDPLPELPDLLERGEHIQSVKAGEHPVFVPVVRMDKPRLLRKMMLEDMGTFAPKGTGIEEVAIKYGFSQGPDPVTNLPDGVSNWSDDPNPSPNVGDWIYTRVSILMSDGDAKTFYMTSRVHWGSIIDDDQVYADKTWSSQKINQEKTNLTNRIESEENRAWTAEQTLQGSINAANDRIEAVERLGDYVGAFDKRADSSSQNDTVLPENASEFPQGITVNDFATIRADETNDGQVTRYVVTSIDESTGEIEWTYDVTYSTDISGKQDKLTAGSNIQITNNIISATDTLPNDATITLQKNGSTVDSFSVNQFLNKTINLALSKSDVGLGNADNTSDANKPVSTATQTALNTKQDKLNRTVGGNDNATGTVNDTGGNLSIPISLNVASPSASIQQITAGTRSLRASVKILVDNIAYLFANKANASDGLPSNGGPGLLYSPGNGGQIQFMPLSDNGIMAHVSGTIKFFSYWTA